MIEGLLEQAAYVEDADDEKALWARFRETMARAGFDWSIYITRADGDPANVYIESDLRGHEERAVRPGAVFEPFLRYCCDSYEITATGVEFMADYPYLDAASREFIEMAGRQGFRSGLGIPMRLQSSGRYGGFNLGTRMDRTRFEREIWPHREAVRAFCLIVHRRAESLLDAERRRSIATRMPAVLSPRERQCIVLLAGGLRVQAIADALGIGEAAVSLYLRNARRKLKARTREQLVAMALTEGRSAGG